MNNPFDKRLLWVSLFFHLAIVFFLAFFSPNSRINRTFLAYGRHSKKITHAYFRRLVAPKNRFVRKVQQKRRSAIAKRKRVVKKKAAPKKLVAKRPVKKVVKKVVAKKKIVSDKVVPKRVAQNKQQIKEEVKEESLHFNLMGESDPAMIMYQSKIQQEVDRVWKPPLGVPKGTECEVSFVIGREGKVVDFKIIKSSKIIIYNLSIIRVAKELKFSFLSGKTFKLNFRQ